MHLEEVLKKTPFQNKPLQDQLNQFVSGLFEQDADETLFRVYLDPNDRSSYLQIPKTAAKGEAHQWTPAETAAAGYVGFEVHRIEVAVGTPVIIVSVSTGKIGETMTMNVGAPVHGKSSNKSYCFHATGCPNGKRCCSRSSPSGGPCYCDDCCVS